MSPRSSAAPTQLLAIPFAPIRPGSNRRHPAVVVTVPLMVLVLLLQRRIVDGLTAGAVKG
jgi:hypothetical protein